MSKENKEWKIFNLLLANLGWFALGYMLPFLLIWLSLGIYLTLFVSFVFGLIFFGDLLLIFLISLVVDGFSEKQSAEPTKQKKPMKERLWNVLSLSAGAAVFAATYLTTN
ncbi:hypothetical protein RA19_02530 [Leisingera sp. ANG-M1]|uniref:hypothetical protein n=1 Tax=Leisingera sp. ANG-M1 TaxID=1577895 RepID=UPI00057E97FB|nr:hypothetical protein [Leisingera sp. ANG-M1]KIC12143.1 hypothetical protein RA19_02530 [Leisingera sp. ANG-M1]